MKIPVWSASDQEIAAPPVPDRWAVMNDAGAIVAGDRPVWLVDSSITAAPAVAAVPLATRTQAPSTTSVPAATVPPSAEAPVTVEGSGIQKSRPFRLAGGNYTLRWTATPTAKTGCFHGGSLKATDQQLFSETVGNELIKDDKPRNGETNTYGVKPGDYYLDMSSGCTWKVVIAPLR